jgi:hypothetical protein
LTGRYAYPLGKLWLSQSGRLAQFSQPTGKPFRAHAFSSAHMTAQKRPTGLDFQDLVVYYKFVIADGNLTFALAPTA